MFETRKDAIKFVSLMSTSIAFASCIVVMVLKYDYLADQFRRFILALVVTAEFIIIMTVVYRHLLGFSDNKLYLAMYITTGVLVLLGTPALLLITKKYTEYSIFTLVKLLADELLTSITTVLSFLIGIFIGIRLFKLLNIKYSSDS